MIQQHYELKNLLVANSFPQVSIITHMIGIYGKGDGSGRTLVTWLRMEMGWEGEFTPTSGEGEDGVAVVSA